MAASTHKASRRIRKRDIAVSAPPETGVPDLDDASLYLNRELSLLAFQRRVLEEAEDAGNPLLERIKFLSIVGSNLDEFFMVRVAGLLEQVEAGIADVGADGMTPKGKLTAIRREVKRLYSDAHRCLEGTLLPALEDAGIFIREFDQLSASQAAIAKKYFSETIFPVLTPLAFDPGRPFPHISNLSLNLAVLIRDGAGEEHFARVKIPGTLPQLVPLTRLGAARSAHRRPPRRTELVWIEQLVAANIQSLFPGMEIVEAHPFHVTRDADIEIKELEAEDLLETVEEGLRQRRFGAVVRLMVSSEMPGHILKILMSNLEIEKTEVYKVQGPLGRSRLMWLYRLDRPELKDPPFVPAVSDRFVPRSETDDAFSMIRRHDILLHHPFDSFQPVVEFLRAAAVDENVLAVKMVLYRVGRNSPIVDALLQAIKNGKQVAVLVELKARFDEESNIEWARKLEAEGVHVVYGLLGLKIHCKVALVVRQEDRHIQRYVHLATGNYNALTAHTYTDLGLFTCDEQIADDVTHLFNYLTGYSGKADYDKLLVAPVNLRPGIRALIEREVAHVTAGSKGKLIFKMNSLEDPSMIRALYRASQAGVKIKLIVRGICCLRPGVPGVSDNIEVTSIVGRFLEHSRVYYFGNAGDDEIYVGSPDLMPRNLDRRVEVVFPVQDPVLRRRIRDEILGTYLADTAKVRRMKSDGTYVRPKVATSQKSLNSQLALLQPQKR